MFVSIREVVGTSVSFYITTFTVSLLPKYNLNPGCHDKGIRKLRLSHCIGVRNANGTKCIIGARDRVRAPSIAEQRLHHPSCPAVLLFHMELHSVCVCTCSLISSLSFKCIMALLCKNNALRMTTKPHPPISCLIFYKEVWNVYLHLLHHAAH